MSMMAKFGHTASDLGYDFWAPNSVCNFFLGHTVDKAWIVSFIVNIKPVQRNFELKKSAYDKEVETARAQAELAFQLQTAKVGCK